MHCRSNASDAQNGGSPSNRTSRCKGRGVVEIVIVVIVMSDIVLTRGIFVSIGDTLHRGGGRVDALGFEHASVEQAFCCEQHCRR